MVIQGDALAPQESYFFRSVVQLVTRTSGAEVLSGSAAKTKRCPSGDTS